MHGLADQARLIGSMIADGWKETYLSRQIAGLPRARACLADLAPTRLIVTTSSAQHLPIWCALARTLGTEVPLVCYSTQILAVQCRDSFLPGVIQDIFMFLNADRYLVWNEFHAGHLRDFGIAADDVEISGPQILSGEPLPGSRKKNSQDAIIIDFFDQPPANHAYLIKLGAPTIYHTPERALATLDSVLTAMRQAFGKRPWLLRIKSKRGGNSMIAAAYSRRLEELAETDDRVVLLPPETSPLYLHPDADAAIGFPFVSPVVSATMAGCPGVFFDATGEVWDGDDIAGGIPVLRDIESLAAWLSDAVTPQVIAG